MAGSGGWMNSQVRQNSSDLLTQAPHDQQCASSAADVAAEGGRRDGDVWPVSAAVAHKRRPRLMANVTSAAATAAAMDAARRPTTTPTPPPPHTARAQQGGIATGATRRMEAMERPQKCRHLHTAEGDRPTNTRHRHRLHRQHRYPPSSPPLSPLAHRFCAVMDLASMLAARRRLADASTVTSEGTGTRVPAPVPSASRTATNEEASRASLLALGGVAPRAPCGYAGLLNQGATCYLNSLIQVMYCTGDMRAALFDWPYAEAEHGEPTRCVPRQLQDLFAEL